MDDAPTEVHITEHPQRTYGMEQRKQHTASTSKRIYGGVPARGKGAPPLADQLADTQLRARDLYQLTKTARSQTRSIDHASDGAYTTTGLSSAGRAKQHIEPTDEA